MTPLSLSLSLIQELLNSSQCIVQLSLLLAHDSNIGQSDQVAKQPLVTISCFSRLVRLMKELSKQVDTLKPGCDQAALSHLERTLGELSRLLSLKVTHDVCLYVFSSSCSVPRIRPPSVSWAVWLVYLSCWHYI